MNFNLLKNATYLQNIYSFIYGALGCLVILMGSYYFSNQSKFIGTVNVTLLVKQYINSETTKNLSETDLKNDVKLFGNQLDMKLQQFAKQHHTILILSDAVIAGAPDFTEIINKQMHDLDQN
jgi:type-F conjugative transfer system protein TrbI